MTDSGSESYPRRLDEIHISELSHERNLWATSLGKKKPVEMIKTVWFWGLYLTLIDK